MWCPFPCLRYRLFWLLAALPGIYNTCSVDASLESRIEGRVCSLLFVHAEKSADGILVVLQTYSEELAKIGNLQTYSTLRTRPVSSNSRSTRYGSKCPHR